MESTWLENPAERPSFADIVDDLNQSKIVYIQYMCRVCVVCACMCVCGVYILTSYILYFHYYYYVLDWLVY